MLNVIITYTENDATPILKFSSESLIIILFISFFLSSINKTPITLNLVEVKSGKLILKLSGGERAQSGCS